MRAFSLTRSADGAPVLRVPDLTAAVPRTVCEVEVPQAARLVRSDTEGEHVALAAPRPGAQGLWDLWLVDADTGRVRQLGLGTPDLWDVCWADTRPPMAAVQLARGDDVEILLLRLTDDEETPVVVSRVARDGRGWQGQGTIGGMLGFDAPARHLFQYGDVPWWQDTDEAPPSPSGLRAYVLR
jgi:hypothetical protein